MPDDISLQERKSILLELLVVFDAICRKHHIYYSLAYGTLLGAVRHKGFIPWDDDVDVMVPRNDYYRLISVLSDELFGSNYCFISLQTNVKYYSPIAKLYDNRTRLIQTDGHVIKTDMGIYIDIFVVDGIPSDPIMCETLFAKEKVLRMKWLLSCRSFFSPLNTSKSFFKYVIKTIASIPFKLKGVRKYLLEYDRLASSNTIEDSQYVGVVLFGEGMSKEKIEKSLFFESSIIDFEGKSFKCIRDWDLYLSNMYGNYMELPPMECRVSKHPSVVQWKR